MKRSTERMLTTHAGSLPRPADLLQMIQTKERGQSYDQQAYAARVRSAVAEIVKKQAELGLDIVDDGEMGKPGFIPYVNERLAGFEPNKEAVGSPWTTSREVQSFPEYYEWASRAMPSPAARSVHMVCTGPITYKGQAHVQRDIENLKAALKGVKAEDVFVPAISPTSVEDWQKNKYYPTEEAYLFAIAEAMNEEYKAIVDAGFVVQIDDPHLSTYYVLQPSLSVAQCRKWAEVRVEALNGVISHSTILVEHPELVAERISRFARVVGRENVIAGADCGFATFAGSPEIHASVVWAKFRSLAEGARLATKQLWGRA